MISFHAGKQIDQAKDIAATILSKETETGRDDRIVVELIAEGVQRRF